MLTGGFDEADWSVVTLYNNIFKDSNNSPSRLLEVV